MTTYSDAYELETPSVWEPRFPGDVQTGTILWGAAYGGNDDPTVRHEDPTGEVLSLHRTFFQWTQLAGPWFNDIVNDDLAKGRIPWVSTKTPTPWTEVTNGSNDTALDAALILLGSKPGPVWLTVWHEPENDPGPGSPADHVAMNAHVRDRMTALGISNVALASILMGWTWNPQSGRNPDDWYAAGIYDFLGVDPYQTDMGGSVWESTKAYADHVGLPIAIGEWGFHGSDQAAGDSVRAYYEELITAGVVGACVFDANQASNQQWELEGEQLLAFHEKLADPRTVRYLAEDLPVVVVALESDGVGVADVEGTLEEPPVIVERPIASSAEGMAAMVAHLSLSLEELMTLQDQLRGEQIEVADTGALLTQAADRIDELEALLASSGDPARIAALEAALDQITAIITGVR